MQSYTKPPGERRSRTWLTKQREHGKICERLERQCTQQSFFNKTREVAGIPFPGYEKPMAAARMSL